MAELKKWKIYCTTESQYRYIWDTTAPTQCPYNNAHSVNTSSVHDIGIAYKYYQTTAVSLTTDGHNVYRLDATSNGVNLSLPAVSTSDNRVILVQRLVNNGNVVNLVPNGSDKINNIASNYALTGNKAITASLKGFVKIRAKISTNDWEVLGIETSTGELNGLLEPSLEKDSTDPNNNKVYLGWDNATKQWNNRQVSSSDINATANHILLGNGTSGMTEIKYNMTATTAPLATDDGPDGGYSVGSIWHDLTADKAYICLDSTNNAAVWVEITSQGTTPVAGNGITVTGSTVSADLKANGGLVFESSKIAIDLSASSITGTLAALDGGTGFSSYTIGDVLYASGATALSKLVDVATGNALISGGVATAPSWGKVGLTTHVTGTLAVASGGTNITSYTIGDILYASGATALSKLVDVATGNALISGGVATAPSWGKIGLTTHVTGTLAVANGGTGATTLTSNGILLGNGTSAVTALKSEFAKTVAPTATDDSSLGYVVGSQWFDTTNEIIYVCINSTVSAAIWKPITNLAYVISSLYSLSVPTGTRAVTTDLIGSFYYRDAWRSVLTNMRLLNPTTYNYAYLTSASNLDHSRSRYWYRWRARDFTAQSYAINALPSTATTGTNYNSGAAQGSAIVYNSSAQLIEDGGSGGNKQYLYVNKSGGTDGSVLFKFGATLGAQQFNTTNDEYQGWSVFMVLKDIVRVGTNGRVFSIDSQRGSVNGGPAYTGTDQSNNDVFTTNFFSTSTTIDFSSNGVTKPMFDNADTTSRTVIVAIVFNQALRTVTYHTCDYDGNTVQLPSLANATSYYENTLADTLQYIRLGSNPTNTTQNCRIKLFELIVINFAIEDPKRTILALYDEYKSS